MLRHSMADQSGARYLRILGRNTKGEWQESSGLGCNSELKCQQQLTEMSTTVNWNVKQKSYGNQELLADIAVLR